MRAFKVELDKTKIHLNFEFHYFKYFGIYLKYVVYKQNGDQFFLVPYFINGL